MRIIYLRVFKPLTPFRGPGTLRQTSTYFNNRSCNFISPTFLEKQLQPRLLLGRCWQTFDFDILNLKTLLLMLVLRRICFCKGEEICLTTANYAGSQPERATSTTAKTLPAYQCDMNWSWPGRKPINCPSAQWSNAAERTFCLSVCCLQAGSITFDLSALPKLHSDNHMKAQLLDGNIYRIRTHKRLLGAFTVHMLLSGKVNSATLLIWAICL